MKRNGLIPIVILLILVLSFFLPSLIRGTLPIPSDTIVGLYHPYRDAYADEYPNGIPYKNSLITDPVRQQYPWKHLAVAEWRDGVLPKWNPYTFSGSPLMANLQSAVYYPLNLLFFLMPFENAWNGYIILQPVLGSIFLYLYLRHLRVSLLASLFGGFTFAFSGFAVAWLTWGNVFHTALWLPLILLSIDKIISLFEGRSDKKEAKKEKSRPEADPPLAEKTKGKKQRMKFDKRLILWCSVFLLSLTFSFFAGHLQIFFYVLVTTIAYIIFRWRESGREGRVLVPFFICSMIFTKLTFIQWYPTWRFIRDSARSIDQVDWQSAGWFIPWQQAVQFVSPDFYGNPTTLNYFGVWNYGEFIGYIGLLPLMLAIFAMLFKREKTVYFFLGVVAVALLFAFPTFIAKLPYQLSLPFISTSQPTRLLFLVDFSLAILAAFGLDLLLKEKKKFLVPVGITLGIFALLWGLIFLVSGNISDVPENIAVAKRNLKLPTMLLFGIAGIYIIMLKVTNKRLVFILLIGLFALTVADISRFAAKFTPFTRSEYLFPQTETITFLKQHQDGYRYMTTDSRIFPPNFSAMYGLRTIEGYDPLYLQRYGEFIAAMERGKPDISSPLGFNRIITPHSITSPFIDLLGVKYILSLSELQDVSLQKVFQEGETRVYENSEVSPRAFFVNKINQIAENEKQAVIEAMYTAGEDLSKTAVVEAETGISLKPQYASGSAEITAESPHTVKIRTILNDEGYLVLMDTFYPTWQVVIYRPDGTTVSEPEVLRTNYAFRGVVVPAGEHIVEFKNSRF